MRIRQAVHETATANPKEVLVVFVENGEIKNHLLRNAPALCAELAATPATLTKPVPTEADPDAVTAVPNPARAVVEAKAFGMAEKELDDAIEAAKPKPQSPSK